MDRYFGCQDQTQYSDRSPRNLMLMSATQANSFLREIQVYD